MPSIFTTHFAFLDSDETIQVTFELGDLSKKPDDDIDEPEINPEPEPSSSPPQDTGGDGTTSDQQEDSSENSDSEEESEAQEEKEEEKTDDEEDCSKKQDPEKCKCEKGEKTCYKDSKRQMNWPAVPGALQTHLKNLAESAFFIVSKEFKRKTKNLDLSSLLRSYIQK